MENGRDLEQFDSLAWLDERVHFGIQTAWTSSGVLSYREMGMARCAQVVIGLDSLRCRLHLCCRLRFWHCLKENFPALKVKSSLVFQPDFESRKSACDAKCGRSAGCGKLQGAQTCLCASENVYCVGTADERHTAPPLQVSPTPTAGTGVYSYGEFLGEGFGGRFSPSNPFRPQGPPPRQPAPRQPPPQRPPPPRPPPAM